MGKQLKNRVSTRKCRHRSKIYTDSLKCKIGKLEKDLEKYKILSRQRNPIENFIQDVYFVFKLAWKNG